MSILPAVDPPISDGGAPGADGITWPPCDVICTHNVRCLGVARLWELKPRVSQTMESFSLLSISGPQLSPSALSTFPDIMSSRATSLPGKLPFVPRHRRQQGGRSELRSGPTAAPSAFESSTSSVQDHDLVKKSNYTWEKIFPC